MNSSKKIVYLDNAATTFPKPPKVYSAVNDCLTHWCGNPGRGTHPLAMRAAEEIYLCRKEIANFFGSDHPENVIFTLNTTHAINTVIKGVLKRGDHALCSCLEHNSVYRPLYKLAEDDGVEFDVFNAFPNLEHVTPQMIISSIDRLVRKNTRLLICTHSSNVCPVSLPIRQIGEYCKDHGIFFALDAAQSAGILPINVKECHIDALCLPAHKGLYGPQGCGIIILGDGVKLRTLTEGGNGVDSLIGRMSDYAPERYEAGTLPTPSIVGLRHGIEFIKSISPETIYAHEKSLCAKAKEGLLSIPGIYVYTPWCVGSLVLFRHESIPSEIIASELGKRNICVRGGYHCAALAHKSLGTPKGGAVRASFGYFNSDKDIDKLIAATADIVKHR